MQAVKIIRLVKDLIIHPSPLPKGSKRVTFGLVQSKQGEGRDRVDIYVPFGQNHLQKRNRIRRRPWKFTEHHFRLQFSCYLCVEKHGREFWELDSQRRAARTATERIIGVGRVQLQARATPHGQ